MSDYTDEEEALNAAIAMSLNEASPSHASDKPGSGVVDLTGDSDSDTPVIIEKENSSSAIDDPGLQRAISHSLHQQVSAMEHNNIRKGNGVGSSNNIGKSESSGSIYGIPGIDRKKMEEERLARLTRKRKAEGLSSPEPREAKVLKSDSADAIDLTTGSGGTLAGPRLQYPDGAVKKTWVFNCKRENDIKIEEVFQKSELKFAVLSSFMWDMDWVFSKMDISKTRFLLVMGAKDEATVNNDSPDRGEVPADSTLTEAGVGKRCCGNTDSTPLFPANGWADQLHALKADASLLFGLYARGCPQCEPRSVRLGRARWYYGKCTHLSFFRVVSC